MLLVAFFVLIEWLGREGQYAIEKIGLNWRRQFRFSFYYVLMFLIIWYSGNQQGFIYFQF